jgi:HEPN domain-containing protein
MIATRDLEAIARSRLREAKALFKSRHYDGAAYLCGYAIELALKARICRHLKWNGFPENQQESKWSQGLKTHDLDALLELSGVQARIKSTYVSDWSAISGNWSSEARYRMIGSFSSGTTLTMIQAAASLLRTLL